MPERHRLVFGSGPRRTGLKRYFINALEMFYSADELSLLLRELGFQRVGSRTVLAGMIGFHRATKPLKDGARALALNGRLLRAYGRHRRAPLPLGPLEALLGQNVAARRCARTPSPSNPERVSTSSAARGTIDREFVARLERFPLVA